MTTSIFFFFSFFEEKKIVHPNIIEAPFVALTNLHGNLPFWTHRKLNDAAAKLSEICTKGKKIN